MLEPRVDIGGSRLVGLQISGAWHATSQMTFERGAAEVRPVQVRLVPTLDLPISSDASLCLGFGAGLDALQMQPTQAPELGVASPGESAFDPVLAGHVGARVPIAGRAFLTALASLDLDLAPTSFVVREGSQSRTLLALPRLRGGFSLALSFAVAGVRRFSPQATEP